MNLLIDTGNTRTKISIFDNSKAIYSDIWEAASLSNLKNLLKKYPRIQRVALSSVSLVSKKLITFVEDNFYTIILDESTPIPIENTYQTPQTLGRDRLAASIGAWSMFAPKVCLVIDAGTCITYDVITGEGKYLGGNIAPGLKMRFEAMHHFTQNLPLVSNQSVNKPLGKTTEEALILGGQFGLTREIEGYIDFFRKKYTGIKIIITGGDAFFFEKQIKKRIFAFPELVHVGLNKILEYNVELSKR